MRRPAPPAGRETGPGGAGGPGPAGQKFDASWDRGQPFPVQNVGRAQVIQGWNEGLVGMPPGSRRLLVIPPDLGYGPRGTGPIGLNETLAFVVDLVQVSG